MYIDDIMTFNRYDGPGRTYFPDETKAEALKKEFAAALLREPDDCFAAARLVFGEDFARVSYVATAWFRDPIVLAERERLLDEFGEEYFLPTKAEYARKVWKEAKSSGMSPEDRIRYLNLYGDIRGFKERPNINNGITTNVTVNKVMLIKDHGGADRWEKMAAAQQHQLIVNGKNAAIDVESREIANG